MSAFPLQDKQKIGNVLLLSHACTRGLKQQTNHSPFKGSLSDNTTANGTSTEMSVLFKRKKLPPLVWLEDEFPGR